MSTPLRWFITGCSTGIGHSLAQAVLAAGHHATLTARKPESLADLVSQYPQTAQAVALDVNEPAQIEAAVAQAAAHWGGLDVVVNNAGYGLEGAFEETPEALMRHQMETNFFGLALVTQAALPHLRQSPLATVFNVASVAGLRGFRGVSLYNASKFAVVGLSEALADELSPFGIRVVSVEPGPYRTDWAGRSMIKTPAMASEDANSPYRELNEMLEKRFSQISGKQPGDPAQIAAALVHGAQQPGALPVHWLFGDEGIEYWQAKLQKYADTSFMHYFPHGKTQLG